MGYFPGWNEWFEKLKPKLELSKRRFWLPPVVSRCLVKNVFLVANSANWHSTPAEPPLLFGVHMWLSYWWVKSPVSWDVFIICLLPWVSLRNGEINKEVIFPYFGCCRQQPPPSPSPLTPPSRSRSWPRSLLNPHCFISIIPCQISMGCLGQMDGISGSLATFKRA